MTKFEFGQIYEYTGTNIQKKVIFIYLGQKIDAHRIYHNYLILKDDIRNYHDFRYYNFLSAFGNGSNLSEFSIPYKG